MSTQRYKADTVGIQQMIEDIGYELFARTVNRLSSDIPAELALSAKEFLDAQPSDKQDALRMPVNELAAEIARQITDQMSDKQKETNDE
ncbi:MAG: hypothetical protein L0G63_01085 [Psychrobacter sp.]|uniref:hypothetical protein n=1 Tax=Psychrobacter sp. TaxID=56811 RepID=UPI0026478CF3|nr:hypothetical protein [Psychrobacter sp.]MDN5619063.1 hypothetical protein [Psychrobacter sp.]